MPKFILNSFTCAVYDVMSATHSCLQVTLIPRHHLHRIPGPLLVDDVINILIIRLMTVPVPSQPGSLRQGRRSRALILQPNLHKAYMFVRGGDGNTVRSDPRATTSRREREREIDRQRERERERERERLPAPRGASRDETTGSQLSLSATLASIGYLNSPAVSQSSQPQPVNSHRCLRCLPVGSRKRVSGSQEDTILSSVHKMLDGRYGSVYGNSEKTEELERQGKPDTSRLSSSRPQRTAATAARGNDEEDIRLVFSPVWLRPRLGLRRARLSCLDLRNPGLSAFPATEIASPHT